MSSMKKHTSRRSFIKNAALGATIAGTVPSILSCTSNQALKLERKYNSKLYGINDQINLALIGSGIQGIYDTNTALQVPGVKLVAVCDLYNGRLDRAKELWGDDLFLTRDYRELLERKDIDAVIVATPDHWHKKITIDALEKGKAVYCEKPMVQNFDEGQAIIDAHKRSGKICQVGSQSMSSLGNEKAKALYKDGAIGEIVLLDMYNDRYSSDGAWQYAIPPDANPDTVDFDTFLGNAPQVPFDLTRFFRWRNYKDYGTGVAGDLFVHAFSSLNFILDSYGPNRAMSTGGLRYWKDGRDVPDVTLTFYDYPETKTHAAFNASFRVNFIAGTGGGGGFKLIGTEGAMEVSSNAVKLVRPKLNKTPGNYSMIAYTEATQKEILSKYNEGQNAASDNKSGETIWEAPSDYKGGHYDHFNNFFQAIRNNGKVIQDPSFGLRAAGASLLANESYQRNEAVNWDAKNMKLS